MEIKPVSSDYCHRFQIYYNYVANIEMISKVQAIKILQQRKIIFFDINDASKIFAIKKLKTLYVLLQRLEKDGVIN